MPGDEGQSIRNDNLRLTLSPQEKDYIEKGLIKTRRPVWVLAILSLGCIVVGMTSIWILYTRIEQWNQLPEVRKYIDGYVIVERSEPKYTWVETTAISVVLITAAVGFVVLLKLIFAILDHVKFRGYRDNHEKFLKQYRRNA